MTKVVCIYQVTTIDCFDKDKAKAVALKAMTLSGKPDATVYQCRNSSTGIVVEVHVPLEIA